MKILVQNEAKEVVKKTLKKVTSTVKHTLGPFGTNVVSKIDGKTIITNDGVSIINSIRLENQEENIVLDIIKEACRKAEKKSGDGTTTSIVLVDSIYESMEKAINNGSIKELQLREELEIISDKVIELIKKNSRKATKEDLLNVATVSSGGNKYIGEQVFKAFEKVNFLGYVDFKLEPSIEDIEIEFSKGYIVESNYLGLEKLNLEKMNKALILVSKTPINSAADLSDVIGYLDQLSNNKNLIIFSEFGQEALTYIYQCNSFGANILPYSLPSFGIEREKTIKEIEAASQCYVIDQEYSLKDYDLNDMNKLIGQIEKIKLKNNMLIFEEIDINRKVAFLEFLESNNRDKLKQFMDGISTVLVGGKTEIEAEEKVLRVQDSINSFKEALKSGIIISGASLLFKISQQLSGNNVITENIMKEALSKPLEQIISNSKVIDLKQELNKVKNSDIEFGFNAKKSEVENLFENGIIDAANTLINSLDVAINIATALITIDCLIYDENEKQKNYGGF